MLSLIFKSVCVLLFITNSYAQEQDNDKDTEFWKTLSREALKESVQHRIIERPAKNVILFLGDGMGVSTVTGARLLKQQEKANRYEKLSFEKFPNLALMNTANLDYVTPDSAGTATAYVCGVKGNKGTVGVNGKVDYKSEDCDLIRRNSVDSFLQWALSSNKSAGFVTTAEVTDASPAATYSYSSNRDYQSSSLNNCTDIARQLIENEPGKSLNVILGGGRRRFLPVNNEKPQEGGDRTDVNLITKWKMLKEQQKLAENSYKICQNSNDLSNLKINDTDYVLGLFARADMEYEVNRNNTDEPSLSVMTETAIKILQKNSKGFALMIEGAKIDKAHHLNKAYYSLYETLEFDRAIETALSMVDLNETLVIVTSDHSHGFVISGYSKRADNLFGFSVDKDSNDIPYTALLYSTGPEARQRKKEELKTVIGKEYAQNALIEMDSAAHSGEDVGAFAIGPWSHLMRSSQQQTYVAHLIGFATCTGNYTAEKHCKTGNSISALQPSIFVLLLIALCGSLQALF